jgi:hypothetical protein
MNAMVGQSSTSGRPPGRRTRSQGDHGQLALLEADEPMWRLDAHTREVGRKGVAVAREILRRSGGYAGPGGEQGTSRAA